MNNFLNHSDIVNENIKKLRLAHDFKEHSLKWSEYAASHHYVHNLTWMGRPILQVPQDIYAIQELCWLIKPDLIIETGVAHGGSLVLSASLLALLDYAEAMESKTILNPLVSKRKVIGIDVEIRKHNRESIQKHPLNHLICLIEGSSTSPSVISEVAEQAKNFNNILVFLDSNHTHDHVLAELVAYAPLVTKGSYCVVWDSGIDDFPEGFVTDRPWGKGNNPKTALFSYMSTLNKYSKDKSGNPINFVIDKDIEAKIMITAASDGFLKRT